MPQYIIRAEFCCSVFLFYGGSYYGIHCMFRSVQNTVQSSFILSAATVFTVCSDLYKTLYCSVFFDVLSGYCIHCMFRSIQNDVLFSLLLCCQRLLYSLYVQICTKQCFSVFFYVARAYCIHCMFRSVQKHNSANKMQHIDLNKNVLLFSLLLCRRLLLYSLYVQICTKHRVVYTKHSIVQSSFMPQAFTVFTICSDLYQTQCCSCVCVCVCVCVHVHADACLF